MHLFRKEVVCTSDHVWEIVKRMGDSLEVEDDDFENNLFYTPPSSPSKPIFTKLEERLVVDCGKRAFMHFVGQTFANL
jgi:hypothetical protein